MKTYNLFISHSWSYSDDYDKLKRLLETQGGFRFEDYSIPKNDPIHTNGTDEELYRAIRQKIESCDVILVQAGVYASYSKWIDTEIKIAKNEFDISKPIVAIKPWRSKRTSKPVRIQADRVVCWRRRGIVSAIRELA